MDTLYHIDHYFPQPAAFGELRLVQIGRLFCAKNMVVEKHLHLDWFELTIVTGGEGIIYTDDVGVPVRRGDIYLSFPADVHAIRSDATHPLQYDFFSFYCTDPAYRARFEALMQSFRQPQERVFTDERIASLIANAIAEFDGAPPPLSGELLTALFHMVTVYLLRDFPEKRTTGGMRGNLRAGELCSQLMQYIDTHIFSLRGLEGLAVLTGHNYCYLSRLFRRTTGRTLQEYYQSSRLRAAELLLQEGKLRVGEIAELLGYASVYSFSKAYKNHYGTSPTGRQRPPV